MYWLTHGYMQSGIFFSREVDNGEAVTFVGKTVLVPKLDEKYAQGELLDSYISGIPLKVSEINSLFP
jgi:hypothetical protein